MLLDGAKELLNPQPARTPFTTPTEPNSSASSLQKDGKQLPIDGTLESDDEMTLTAEMKSLFVLMSAPMRRHNAIQSLQSLSLVSYDAHTGGTVLRIHDLVRELSGGR